MNYRTFLDSKCTYTLSDVYKVLTKKYFKGRNNRVVHHKVVQKMTIVRPTNVTTWDGFDTRKPKVDGVRKIILYSDLYDGGHISLSISKDNISIGLFDIIGQQLICDDFSEIALREIMQSDISEERFFQFSTVNDTHGLTHQEFLTLQKIWNILKD